MIECHREPHHAGRQRHRLDPPGEPGGARGDLRLRGGEHQGPDDGGRSRRAVEGISLP